MPAFIKFDGVDGEASDKDHKGWSDLLSFSYSSSRSGASLGKSDLSLDLSVVKVFDKSSPILMSSVCAGKVFPKVEIDLTAANADERQVSYLKYELRQAVLTSYQQGSSGGQDLPVEQISIKFAAAKQFAAGVEGESGMCDGSGRK